MEAKTQSELTVHRKFASLVSPWTHFRRAPAEGWGLSFFFLLAGPQTIPLKLK